MTHPLTVAELAQLVTKASHEYESSFNKATGHYDKKAITIAEALAQQCGRPDTVELIVFGIHCGELHDLLLSYEGSQN